MPLNRLLTCLGCGCAWIACAGSSADRDGRSRQQVDYAFAPESPRKPDAIVGTQAQELVATGGATNDAFGQAFALNGTTLLVGAPGRTVGANGNQGAAYVFVYNGTTWTQQAGPLVASDGAANDFFGTSVALSGSIAVIGASGKKIGANANQGAAYVFVNNGGTWTQQGPTLVSSDGAAGDYFGASVAVDGTTALVGASQKMETFAGQGAVYTFVQAGSTWGQQGTPIVDANSQPAEAFGAAIALQAATALIGAPASNVYPNKALVYVKSGATWTLQAELQGSDTTRADYFGSSLALNGYSAIIGASEKNNAVGEAYIFTNSGGIWTQQGPPLLPTGTSGETGFGRGVALSGNTALVGASYIGSDQGGAFVYTLAGQTWTQQAPMIQASDGAGFDLFGDSVALSGTMALIGALGHTVNGNSRQGTVYDFQIGGLQGAACSTPSDCATSYVCNSGHCSPQCQVCTGTAQSSCTPLSGTSCDDGNACTRTDTCQNGTCVGTNPVTCTASDQCHLVGTCDPTSGVCSNPAAANGATCNDGNACTQTDTCQAGVCTGSNPVTCTMPNQCQVNGTCDTTTGICNYPPVTDGTPCSDGNLCTQTDACMSGTCVGSNQVTCTPLDQCHLAGNCIANTGVCNNPDAPNGTPCTGGTCEWGTCTDAGPPEAGVPDATSPDASSNDAGVGGDAAMPTDGGTMDGASTDAAHGGMDAARPVADAGQEAMPEDAGAESGALSGNTSSNSGCSCQAAGVADEGLASLVTGALVALLAGVRLSRRRRSAALRGP